MGQYVNRRKRDKRKTPKTLVKTSHQIESDNLKDKIYLEYMKQGGYESGANITEICCQYRPNATRQANVMYGWRILNDPDIKQRFSNKMTKRREKDILSFDERLQFLTSVVMGDVQVNAEAKDLLRAIDLMNRMEGVYVNNNVNMNINQTLTVDQQRDIVQQRLNLILGGSIDGEVVNEETVEETQE